MHGKDQRDGLYCYEPSYYEQVKSKNGQIFQSEIGIDEYGNNYIRLVTSEGYVLYIGFKKFRVLNKKYY